MIKIYLIRHGKTDGNNKGAYLGRTDEPLNDEGILQAMNAEFPKTDKVYTSTKLRCIQTAGIIFPDSERIAVDDFRECDFGDFEGKNFEELKNDPEYKTWLETGGQTPFPNGESMSEFQGRCVYAFEKILENELNKDTKALSFVVHGGTIMALLDKFADSGKRYYDWQAKNCHGFSAVINKDLWSDEKKFYSIESI